MNRLILLSYFITITANVSIAQDALTIENIYMGQTARYSPEDSVITFPTFLGSQVASKINHGLLEYLNSSQPDAQESSIRAALDSTRYNREKNKSGLAGVSYEVFYSKNTVSLQLYMEGMGAYLSTWTDYLTFSTLTGNRLVLDSLISQSGRTKLQKLIKIKQERYLTDYEYEMQENQIVDTRDSLHFNYNWAVDYAKKHCFSSPNYADIIIDEYTIKLNVRCGFPHATRALAPYGDLEFSKHSLKPILRKEYVEDQNK